MAQAALWHSGPGPEPDTGTRPRLCSPSQDRPARDVLTGTVLAEPWGGARYGQGLPGRTGQEHPLGARPVAPRAFTVEGPTGWRCHDTRLSRHCPARKPTGFGAGLSGRRAVPHSSGFPVGKGSRQPWWLQSQRWEGCLWPQRARWGLWPTEAQHHASPQPCPQKASCPAAAPLILGGNRGSRRPVSPKPPSPTAPRSSHRLQAHHPLGKAGRPRAPGSGVKGQPVSLSR